MEKGFNTEGTALPSAGFARQPKYAIGSRRNLVHALGLGLRLALGRRRGLPTLIMQFVSS